NLCEDLLLTVYLIKFTNHKLQEHSNVIQKTVLQISITFLFTSLVLALSNQAFAQNQAPYTFKEHHMGTLFKITLYAESDSVAELAAANAFLEIDRLNSMMSDYLEDSELNRF